MNTSTEKKPTARVPLMTMFAADEQGHREAAQDRHPDQRDER